MPCEVRFTGGLESRISNLPEQGCTRSSAKGTRSRSRSSRWSALPFAFTFVFSGEERVRVRVHFAFFLRHLLSRILKKNLHFFIFFTFLTNPIFYELKREIWHFKIITIVRQNHIRSEIILILLAQTTVYFEKNERKRERKEISSTFAFAFEFFRKNALALAFVNVNANAANAFFFERVRCNPASDAEEAWCLCWASLFGWQKIINMEKYKWLILQQQRCSS